MPMYGGDVPVGHKPIMRNCRKVLETANSRSAREICEGPRRADVGDDRCAQHARDDVADCSRALGQFHPAYIRDRAFQSARGRLDRGLRGSTQIEAASCAEMLWDEFSLIEGRDSTAASRASIPKTATMRKAGHTRCQPPLPPKIRGLVGGKAKRTILHPGRTMSASVFAQRQEERRQGPTSHRHRRDRHMRNARPIAEQGSDVARKPKVEAGRPHPVTKPQDAGERPRRDSVGEREAMNPARRQLVVKRVDENRPPIANDVPVSLADLDGKTRAGRVTPHSRPSRIGARRRFETGT